MAALEDSLKLRRQMTQRWPTNVQRRHSLLTTCSLMGTAYHDDGQLDRATALLEEAIQAGEYLTLMDPTVTTWRRGLYAAHHQLARFLQEAGDLDGAAEHCAAAVRLAEGLSADEPDAPEWRRIVAFSYIRRGRLLLAGDQPQLAHEEFEKAAAIRLELGRRVPEDLALRAELASAHDWLGKSSGRLGRAEKSREHYAAAHEIRRSLLAAQPEVTKRALDVILSQTKLATWHLHQRTVEDDRAAGEWLDKAEPWLIALREAGKLSAWEGRYAAWMGEIEKSRRLIARRRAQRAGRAASGKRPSRRPLVALASCISKGRRAAPAGVDALRPQGPPPCIRWVSTRRAHRCRRRVPALLGPSTCPTRTVYLPYSGHAPALLGSRTYRTRVTSRSSNGRIVMAAISSGSSSNATIIRCSPPR